jgi:hypothetical protein
MTEAVFASERQDYDRHLDAEIVAMLHDAWRMLALLHANLNLNLKVREPRPSEPQLPAVAWGATRLLSLPLASSGGPVAAFRAPAARKGRAWRGATLRPPLGRERDLLWETAGSPARRLRLRHAGIGKSDYG